MAQLLHLPVSETAYNQLQNVIQEVAHIQLNDEQDTWKYQWGSAFSSSNAYKIIVGHSQHHPAIRWIWNYFCQPKHRVFLLVTFKGQTNS